MCRLQLCVDDIATNYKRCMEHTNLDLIILIFVYNINIIRFLIIYDVSQLLYLTVVDFNTYIIMYHTYIFSMSAVIYKNKCRFLYVEY